MTEQIILIALIQGFTEFLPISSSGHLSLLHGLTRFEDPGLAMDVSVHVGTVLAVMLYNWRVLQHMSISLLTLGTYHRDKLGVAVSAVLATIPVVIAGYFLNKDDGAGGWVLDSLRNVEVIAWATLIFGIVLGLTDRLRGRRRLATINISDALVIGLAQVLALVPGTSRAGITMSAARIMGLSHRAAVRFSMVLSIPVILGSGVLKGLEVLEQAPDADMLVPMAMAAGLAAVVALLSISLMMAIVERIGFMPFVLYRVALGLVLLGWIYLY